MPATPTTKAFQAFGDTNDYSLAPDGGFESGTAGWSLSGGSGDRRQRVLRGARAPSDSKSLAINATGTAVSPAFCVGIEHPTFRFFARRTSGTWGVLNVKLRWQGRRGATNETVGRLGRATGDTAWRPHRRSIALSTVLRLWNGDQSASVQIVFDPEDYGGSWAIDDVYVDPYSRA